MNTKVAKKLRKQYRIAVAKTATKDVRTLMVRLTRKRDILGLIAIAEAIVIVILIIAAVVK